MSQQEQRTESTETVVDSYPTRKEAWDQAHKFAALLKAKGLSGAMGVTVKRAKGSFWIVLVKRG